MANSKDLALLPLSGQISRNHLRQLLEKSPSLGLREVLGGYGALKSKLVNIDSLRNDFEQAIDARELFARLGCRGFSYSVYSGFDFVGDKLRQDINVRIALLPESDLFYPYRLRKYLQRSTSNHVRAGGFESIAFALVSVKDRNCQILVLQSDLARRRPSYVREHFRGWRKILFLSIVNYVRNEADSICLFRASDVARACHYEFTPTPKQITAWETIYEQTANDFGLQPTWVENSYNLQIYASQKEISTRFAYVGQIQNILKRYSS